MGLEFIGAFESTYIPAHDIDVAEMSGHASRWEADLRLLLSCGVNRTRYPIRWHRVETEQGVFDWRETDAILGWMGDNAVTPIVDILHHTSYPGWLTEGFADPRFAASYMRYCEAFAKRYPQVREYTLMNEPLTTTMLCGLTGLWPPHRTGVDSFVSICRNVLPALGAADQIMRANLTEPTHVYVEPCEFHSSDHMKGRTHAVMANDRRFFMLDALLGNIDVDERRPFVTHVLEAGGADLLELEPLQVDVLGLDYYAHLEWSYGDECATCPSPDPLGLKSLIMQYWDRYRLPMILGETNIRGYGSDRATWLKYTLEQCELAVAEGADLGGYCWFPFIDSTDWDSMLLDPRGSLDPVGVYWLDRDRTRRESSMSESYRLAAAGAHSSELPAYRFQPPVDSWVAGLMPQMRHWEWQDPPLLEVLPPLEPIIVVPGNQEAHHQSKV